MDRSLNEIEALCKRAARGAGAAWGVAEDAGKAARWLASHGLPGPALLADLLVMNDGMEARDLAPASLDGIWSAPGGRLCPLMAGAVLSDLHGNAIVEMQDVSHPLLLLPFAASVAEQTGTPFAVTWQDMRAVTDGRDLSLEGPQEQVEAPDAARVSCRPVTDMAAGRAPAVRGDVAVRAWDMLSKLAHRTYAPATEASRLLGAGAGLSDND